MFIVSSFKAFASRADIILFDVIGCYIGSVNDNFNLALTFYRAGASYSTFKLTIRNFGIYIHIFLCANYPLIEIASNGITRVVAAIL